MGDIIAGAVTGFFGAPVPTLLMVMGFVVIIFSVLLKVEDGDAKKLKIGGRDHVYWPGLIPGILLFSAGLFYQSIMAAQTPPTPTPTVTATSTPPLVTATLSPTATMQPSATASETPTPFSFGDSLPVASGTPTVTATITVTNTPSPTKALTIKEHGCIFASTWQVVSPGSITLTENTDDQGCLSLGAIGITADKSGILYLRRTAKNIPLTAGIYTPIGSRSVIEFKVFVKSFYIINTETPASINFAVASAADPLDNSNSARFKLSVDTAVLNPYIFFLLADLGEANGSKVITQHYEYQHTYNIRIELTGAIIRVYINDTQMIKDLSVPVGPKVFLINYKLPTLANADIQITDIQVDGINK